ncbi:hypothetical protein KFE94_07965 [bacterium SCSIO 12643]|nr:hypothetical protein KFE94_07965 [bacterium SCSIO 12643]
MGISFRKISIVTGIVLIGLIVTWIIVEDISLTKKGALERLKNDIESNDTYYMDLVKSFCKIKTNKGHIYFNYFHKTDEIEFLLVNNETTLRLNEDSILLNIGQNKTGLIRKMRILNLENCFIYSNYVSFNFSNSHAFISNSKIISGCSIDKEELDIIQNSEGYNFNLYVMDSYISISDKAIDPVNRL